MNMKVKKNTYLAFVVRRSSFVVPVCRASFVVVVHHLLLPFVVFIMVVCRHGSRRRCNMQVRLENKM
jgi:hypothetical protein